MTGLWRPPYRGVTLEKEGAATLRQVPLAIFDGVEHAVFVADEEGRIDYCNAAAGVLLEHDPAEVIGRYCWQITRFCAPDGSPLCVPRCSVQRMACQGTLPESIPALFFPGGDRPAARLRLRAFPVSVPRGGRLAIVHLLTRDEDAPSKREPATARADHAKTLSRLTVREREVLNLLASGKTTMEIAEALFVSPVTVRNHIRHILEKLGAHHRIEAVLALLSAT